MNIYTPTTITEEIERKFKPTRLAVKELNGLKYFCKTVRKNILKYPGSGIFWYKHVCKYGKKNIKTLWVSDWFYCPHHLQEFALMYSEYNQVVESNEWANLRPENGLDGASAGHEPYWNPTEEELIEHGLKSKKMWENTDFRERMIESQQKSWTPKRRVEQIERLSGKKRPEHSEIMKSKPKHPNFKCDIRTNAHKNNIAKSLSGVTKSEEHKKNMRISRANRKLKPKFEIDGMSYVSLKQASDALGISTYFVKKKINHQF